MRSFRSRLAHSLLAPFTQSLLVPLALGAMATLALLAIVPARASTRSALEPEQVACNRDQLAALAARTRVSGPDGEAPAVPQAVYLTYSNRYGFYEGMVVGLARFRDANEPPVDPLPTPGPEHQLGFHLNPSIRELLLNPLRIPLDQVGLARETSTSTLVAPDDPFAVVLRVDPSLSTPGPGAKQTDLVIDNLFENATAGGGPHPADTKPGRGLTVSGLTRLCHTRLSDVDRRVFAILQRTLRAELYDPATAERYDTRITLYRGTDPEIYRADIYVVDPKTGAMRPTPLEAEIRVELDETGRLAGGHLELPVHRLPDDPAVVGSVTIVRPLFGGVDDEYVPEVGFPVGGPLPGAPSSFYDFDWRDVLDGTAWNPATVVTSTCGQGTAAELAATPRAQPEIELLAIGMTGEVTAPQEVYDRVDRDLAAIMVAVPQLAGFPIVLPTDGKSLLVATQSGSVGQAMVQGGYHDWDCLNDWYGLESVAQEPFSDTRFVVVQLEGTYNLDRVGDDYAALPGVAYVRPYVLPTPGVPPPELCAMIAPDGQTYRYFFGGLSDVVTYVTTDPDGSVELVGIYSSLSANPSPPPPWLPLVDQCHAELGTVRN